MHTGRSCLLYTSPDAKQPFEIVVTEAVLEGACDPSYPLQKKRHSFEYMREIAHLRPRANTFYAVFRLRSVLSMAIHEFFQDQGFVYVHTPIPVSYTHLDDGLTKFKANFNPTIDETIGEFDLPVNKSLYKASEMAYKLRKKMKVKA